MYNNDGEEISKDLLKFKSIIHPIKLTTLTILYRNYRVSAVELRKLLAVPWGTLESHIRALIKLDLVETRKEFEDGIPRLILYLTTNGHTQYREMRKAIQDLLK